MSNLDTARQAWGDAMPPWVEILAKACDAASQNAVSKRLGTSASAVNQALKRSYNARYDGLEKRVQGAFMGAAVECPALRCSIPLQICVSNQAKPYDGSNHQTVRIFRTCPTCPNRIPSREEEPRV